MMLKLTISVIAVALAASSCSTTLNTKKMNTDTTGLSVKIQSTNAIAVKNPTGKIRLYAVSAQIADVPATMILEKSFTANQIPFDLKLDLPKNHLKLIQPKVSDAEPIKYYVTLDWDSNGDGEKGKGDIAIDFTKSFLPWSLDKKMKFLSQNPNNKKVSQEVFVGERDSSWETTLQLAVNYRQSILVSIQKQSLFRRNKSSGLW